VDGCSGKTKRRGRRFARSTRTFAAVLLERARRKTTVSKNTATSLHNRSNTQDARAVIAACEDELACKAAELDAKEARLEAATAAAGGGGARALWFFLVFVREMQGI
jgi:hypothetical protein